MPNKSKRYQPWIRDRNGKRLAYLPTAVSAHPEVARRVRILAKRFNVSASFVLDCAAAAFVDVDVTRFDDLLKKTQKGKGRT